MSVEEIDAKLSELVLSKRRVTLPAKLRDIDDDIKRLIDDRLAATRAVA